MKGILFTETMFRAVVAGAKTQTRRIVSLDWLMNHDSVKFIGMVENPGIANPKDLTDLIVWKGVYPKFYVFDSELEYYCCKPRYQQNDIVYLKEPYSFIGSKIIYKFNNEGHNVSWYNKLFMPASEARYFIRIKDVRVDNIKNISEQDAIAEGFKDKLEFFVAFMKINKVKLLSQTPWVFVYTFELTEKPESLTTQY